MATFSTDTSALLSSYQTLVDQTSEVMFLLDEAGLILSLSESAKKWDFPSHHIKPQAGENLLNLLESWNETQLLSVLKDCSRGSSFAGLTTIGNTKTHSTAIPIWGKDSGLYGLLLTIYVANPSKSEMERLHLLYETTIENFPEGILVADLEQENYLTNPKLLQIFGLSASEMEEEFGRIKKSGKWDRSFPFSIKNLLSFPENEKLCVQIFRSSEQPVFAEIFIKKIQLDSGNTVFLLQAAEKIKTENLSTNTRPAQNEKSQKSLHFLRQVLNQDPNFIYIRNASGEMEFANQAVAQFFDTSVEQFLIEGPELLKTYKWRYEESEDLANQVLKTRKSIASEEAIFNRETKKMHLFQLSRSPFELEDGSVGILTVGMDITDRVNAENELITQREYLRHILDTDPNLIFVKNASGRILLVNKAFAEFYGDVPENLIGKTDQQLNWPEEALSSFIKADQEVMQSNQSITSEEKWLNPITGKPAFVVTTKTPLLDADGNFNILGVVTDITKQKQQEDIVRKSEELLQQIFNRVADGLLLVDYFDLRILDANQRVLDLLDLPEISQLKDKKINLIKVKSEQGGRYWKQAFANLSQANLAEEIEIETAKNRTFWAGIAATRFAQAGKELVLIRLADIQQQKQSEEAIRQALHEKEILIQEIHHRVKNNMAVISSLLQLQTGYIKDPVLIDVFKDSQSRIRSMALIHEKLYQSSTLAKVEMQSYIKELVRTLYYTYRSSQTQIDFSIEVENVFLDINSAVPCGLIINEMVSNAFKHAFTGKEKGHVWIRFQENEKVYQLEIEDNGNGLPPEMNIQQSKSLGMNLVQALASQLGAKLEISSINGLRFSIQFSEKIKPNRT